MTPGRWRDPKEPLLLLGKQKMNLRARLQGSGLPYLLSPHREGLFRQEISIPQEKPFPFSMCTSSYGPGRCSVHAAPWNTPPCCSCCHGTARGHQPSPPALGEGPPRSPAHSFWGCTAPRWLFNSPAPGGLKHGKEKAFIFRNLQLFLAFLP